MSGYTTQPIGTRCDISFPKVDVWQWWLVQSGVVVSICLSIRRRTRLNTLVIIHFRDNRKIYYIESASQQLCLSQALLFTSDTCADHGIDVRLLLIVKS